MEFSLGHAGADDIKPELSNRISNAEQLVSPLKCGCSTRIKTVNSSRAQTHTYCFADGKVAEIWANTDIFSLVQQLGLIPAPGQAG